MTFQIPKSEREHMAALVSANPALLDAIARTLESCPPSLSQHKFGSQIARKLADVPSVSPSTITSIMRTLFAVHAVLMADTKTSAADAAAETIESLQKDGSYDAPPEGWDSFRKRLTQLLSSRTLGIAAKAGHVALQTPRHAHGLRILTDARPVYGENAKDSPIAFTILHTLQVEYFEAGENREWFISLDADDVENLRSVADRAIQKEASLRTTLGRLDLPILSWESNSDDE
jgi:hypothetical protein